MPLIADRYTPEQIDRALKALVLADKNVGTAARRLEQDGLPIPERTLRDWRNIHAAQIEVLEETRDRWVQIDSAEDWESFNADALGAAKKMIAELSRREDWESMNVQSLANAIQKVTTAAAIGTDKSRLLRDQPTQITESRDLPALMAAAARLLPGIEQSPLYQAVIDSTAEEVEAPELPEGESRATPAQSHPNPTDPKPS